MTKCQKRVQCVCWMKFEFGLFPKRQPNSEREKMSQIQQNFMLLIVAAISCRNENSNMYPLLGNTIYV